MWLKYFITLVLLYLFAVLQDSFFVHYSLFGATPNLVFVLFFTLVFFSRKGDYYYLVFCAIFAGLFLDTFSTTFFGLSIIILSIVGFTVKWIQAMLQIKKNDNFPFSYFLPIFFVSLLAYDLILQSFSLYLGFFVGIVYNLALASIFFYIYKKFFLANENNRQLNLFNQ
jgi:cell shape-determining protein MreD